MILLRGRCEMRYTRLLRIFILCWQSSERFNSGMFLSPTHDDFFFVPWRSCWMFCLWTVPLWLAGFFLSDFGPKSYVLTNHFPEKLFKHAALTLAQYFKKFIQSLNCSQRHLLTIESDLVFFFFMFMGEGRDNYMNREIFDGWYGCRWRRLN